MKYFSKLAIMTICLLITALFTTACGGGGSKATPPSYPYYTDNSNLTLTGLLNAENIATADIFYSVDNTAKSADEDQEILKAEPTANDKTKFKLPDNIDIANVKIKAILTYDSEGNLLDYFSSYEGVSAENGSFNINFENENGDFGGGSGTEADPYLISQPKHFANMNKKDDQGDYLYLGKQDIHFKQDKDLDFTHLTGLKIVKAEDDKDITIETTNEKAPFYNEGHGLTPIGEIDENHDEYYFAGTYEGNNKIIDGILLVNTPKYNIGLFTGFDNVNIQNLTIGENSIIFIDENNENYSNDYFYIGVLVAYTNKSTIKNCTNNAKIIVKNIEITSDYYSQINGIMACGEDSTITNCTNNGNITIDKSKFHYLYANGIVGGLYTDDVTPTVDTCTNNGDITITNNTNSNTDDNLYLWVSGIIGDTENGEIKNCTNNGNIIVSNNSNLWLFSGGIIAQAYTVNITSCANKGNITISNNTITDSELDCYIYAYGIAYVSNTSNTKISEDCTNGGTITVTDNADYGIEQGDLYNED